MHKIILTSSATRFFDVIRKYVINYAREEKKALKTEQFRLYVITQMKLGDDGMKNPC